MATGPIETHLHRSFNWENAVSGALMGPRGRSANCGNGLFAQCVRLRSEINPRVTAELIQLRLPEHSAPLYALGYTQKLLIRFDAQQQQRG